MIKVSILISIFFFSHPKKPQKNKNKTKTQQKQIQRDQNNWIVHAFSPSSPPSSPTTPPPSRTYNKAEITFANQEEEENCYNIISQWEPLDKWQVYIYISIYIYIKKYTSLLSLYRNYKKYTFIRLLLQTKQEEENCYNIISQWEPWISGRFISSLFLSLSIYIYIYIQKYTSLFKITFANKEEKENCYNIISQWEPLDKCQVYIYIYGDAKVGGIVVLSSIVREFAKVKPKTMKNYEKKASEKL